MPTNEPGLNVNIVHKSTIDKLVRTHNNFSFLKNFYIQEDDSILWNMEGNDSYCIQAIFIGKTGYGKSTTLNKLCGQELFKTDDINSCTKTLFSAEYKIHDNKNYYFSLCDLPGIGESISADKVYLEYYADMLKKSHCVIYVMRADQRDYSKDLEILKPMLGSDIHKKKIMLAVNFIDKIEPVSRSNPFKPNEQQLENIEKKLLTIHKIFNIPKTNIVFYSAVEEYNMNKIVKKIADILKELLKTYPEKKQIMDYSFKCNLPSTNLFFPLIPSSFAGCSYCHICIHLESVDGRGYYWCKYHKKAFKLEHLEDNTKLYSKHQEEQPERKRKKKKELTFQERKQVIYEMTSQDNCGECGCKNCMQFAMQAASLNNSTELEECPHIDPEKAAYLCNYFEWL